MLVILKMTFSIFATYLAQLEKTASRNQMTEILAELFHKLSSQEIDKACYLSLGQLAPKYEGLEFNMAEKLMVKSVARSLTVSDKEIARLYKESGDLGNTIYQLKIPAFSSDSESSVGRQNSKLSINEVYEKLLAIAKDGGEGSVERKIEKMAALLSRLDPLSRKYLVRMPLNKLRLGFSDMTILDSLSWMETADKSLRKDLEAAFNVLADIGRIAKIFKEKGLEGICEIKSEVGVPIRSAKAERLGTPEKILEKMAGKCVVEPKVDGMRMQLHLDKTKKFQGQEETTLSLFEKKGDFVRIFSRNLENMTYMFPDIVTASQKLKVKKVILDGEAIAFDSKTGKFLPFQETVQRKRKHGIGKKAQEKPLKVFVFDILNLDGKTLLNKPFAERRRILEKIFAKSHGEESRLLLTPQKKVTQKQEFDKFFKEMVSGGLEGLMAKKLDAVYQAGARNFNWVKYKVGMQSELADTIDCVVMGYYKGKGKRSGFGLGAFLVGILAEDEFLTVSKIGTGLTDEQWREMYKKAQSAKLKGQNKPENYIVHKNLFPDVWCLPKIVVEIEADTITKSPIHTAGLALRFPRLKRFREDKDVQEITTLVELRKLKKI